MVRFKAKNKKGNPLGVSGPPSVGRLWKTQEEFRFSALPGNLETIEEIPSSGQDGGIHRNSTSLNNQKEDNSQSKISKQPEVPENQTAWNSDNQGVKETAN